MKIVKNLSRMDGAGKATTAAALAATAQDDVQLEANATKLRAQINAEVQEIKTRLMEWLNRYDPHHTSPASIAPLEIAFERALDTHETDAGEYINMVFQHVAQQRKNRLQ